MRETKTKVERLCKLQSQLTSAMECEMGKGADSVCTEEAGQVIDMIKDLAEAEEKCWKACYYKKIVKAMEEYEEQAQCMGMMGWGRMGFSPDPDPMRMSQTTAWPGRDWGRDMPREDPNRVDYDRSARHTMDDAQRSAQDRYRDAKRYFTETKTPESKTRMNHEAKECLDESIMTMRDIWVEADPELQEKMKRDLMNLMREMGL